MPEAPPTRAELLTDHRVEMNKETGKYEYEDEHGMPFEWIEGEEGKGVWLPIVSEDLLKAQQAAYSVEGVDEAAPVDVITNKKRKKPEEDFTSNTPIPAAPSSSKPSKPKVPRPITDVYVTNLPPHATPTLLASIFSRAGLLMTTEDGEPKIKLYTDASGAFKGDALVSYFKEGSVDLAVRLFDETELELGMGGGNIRVSKAEYKAPSKEAEKKNAEASGSGGGGGGGGGKAKKQKKGPPEDKKKAAKRIRNLQSKLEDWHSNSSASEDDDSTPLGASKASNSRFARVVVLKHMFTLDELEEDPALLLDLKDDVREEAESIGVVTNVVLYDKEESGVMTVKFRDAISAQACILKMNGRLFAGRKVHASLYTGKERFKQSGSGANEFLNPEEREAEEKKRLDNFAAWLVDGDQENGDAVET